MGGFISSPKLPKPPPPAPQRIPPKVPSPADPRVVEAGDQQKNKSKNIRRATIRTSPQGILGEPLGQKTLLGI